MLKNMKNPGRCSGRGQGGFPLAQFAGGRMGAGMVSTFLMFLLR